MEKNFAKDADETTIKQFTNCLEEKFVLDGALMPDAHKGYVAPIGAVLITKGFVVPSWVGYDIGCGVTAVRLSGKNLLEKVRKNSKKIYEEIEKNVPMGLGKLRSQQKISKEGKKNFEKLLKELEKKAHDEKLLKWIKRKGLSNLGTLGSGNHFIEINYYKKEVWLIVHSGSRHIGHQVAEHYMKKAMELEGEKGNLERTFALKHNSKEGKEYLAVLEFCLEFALINRTEIVKEVVEEIEKVIGEEIKWKVWANKNHNHAERIDKTNNFIHRKGATPSKKNEKGIIPGNMRDGSYLVIGKGNKKFLESSSHGAGRKMSRSEARKKISIKDFEKTMKGINARIEKSIIDESPFAYKEINEIMKAQEKSVKIVKHLKPIINCKGK